MCTALVVIPTFLDALVTFNAIYEGHDVTTGIIITGLIFVVTAFFAGGALTLVSVEDNTRQIVQILQRMEKTELRPMAVDVHRMEGSARDARNQAAVGAAISPGGAPDT